MFGELEKIAVGPLISLSMNIVSKCSETLIHYASVCGGLLLGGRVNQDFTAYKTSNHKVSVFLSCKRSLL